MTNTKLIWLDDIRNPFKDNWILSYAPEFSKSESNIIWLKSYTEFIKWINKNGIPSKVCFDHDLGDSEMTGYDCAKWLATHCMNNNIKLPKWEIQSANPVGKTNINSYLNNYLKHIENERY